MVDILFGVFAGGALRCSLAVITAANPVHAVLFLVLAFCNATGLRRLLQLEFRARILLVVYVGAVRVLFLFVVRRLNVQPLRRDQLERQRYLPRVSAVGFLFLRERGWVVGEGLGSVPSGVVGSEYTTYVDLRDKVTNLETLGYVLYTHYFICFLRAGLVLLVARVGAIVLTLTAPSTSAVKVLRQQVHQQLSRNAQNAVFLTSVEVKK